MAMRTHGGSCRAEGLGLWEACPLCSSVQRELCPTPAIGDEIFGRRLPAHTKGPGITGLPAPSSHS